jgi:hypothetical protein
MTVHPLDIDHELITELLSRGLDNLAIQEAANVGFHYSLITRVADAFDFPVPQGVQQKRLANMLNITGKLLRAARAEETRIMGEQGVVRPPEVEAGREHLLHVDGETDPMLRKAIEAFVVAQWGLDRQGHGDIPEELKPYLKKLALYAYKITDEDMLAIRKAGYSDDMVYEITLVGAVGAALVGLEAVYQHLYG